MQFNDNITGAIEFTVTWERDGIPHEEWFLGRKINPVNDIFPRGMREALEGKQAGETISLTYEPRLCIPRHKESLVQRLPLDRLRPTRGGHEIIPRVGRFYPQGHISGLLDVYPDTLTPFRLIDLNEKTFTADRNHPLANIPVTIKAKIQYLEKRETGSYGSLIHWREKTCDWGPGMQTMHQGQPTDFFLPDFFDRENGDATPTPPPMDAKAKDNLNAIHARFLKPGMRVLQPGKTPKGEYDAIILTQTMEYQSDPIAHLKYLATHLTPNGLVLVGFTNHFDANTVIKGWTRLHEFERMGLVLEYLRQAGLDRKAGTVSMRKDWRPKDDFRFFEMRGISDPVYMVYGHKH